MSIGEIALICVVSVFVICAIVVVVSHIRYAISGEYSEKKDIIFAIVEIICAIIGHLLLLISLLLCFSS